MYEAFFGLRESPFSIAPNPLYLYMSHQHHEALAHLVYGVTRGGGFVLLTGEVGTGKTTLCRCFLEQVPPDTDVAMILNPMLSAEQLLASMCDELSIPYIGDEITLKELVDAINAHLLVSHAKGRHTVLIVDEAQNLDPKVLEQLRLLTNLETNDKKLLQIVLLGQPELQAMFAQPSLRQLSQRVTARFHLNALPVEEMGPYVRHRLGVAGGRDIAEIFPEATLRVLHRVSGGVPRIINVICDRALLGAYAQSRRRVDVATLKIAAREVLGQEPAQTPRGVWVAATLLLLTAVIVTGASIAPVLSKKVSGATADTVQTRVSDASETSRAAMPAPPGANPLTEASDAVVPASGASDIARSSAGLPDTSADVPTPTDISDLEPFLMSDRSRAIDRLLSVAGGVGRTEGLLTCESVRAVGRQCYEGVGAWASMRALGFPVLLDVNLAGDSRFALLREVSGQLEVVDLEGNAVRIDRAQLDDLWNGRFMLVWQRPKSYRGPVLPGQQAALVAWIRGQLNAPGSEGPDDLFDDALVEHVRRFQRVRGLRDDGIVGEVTLMHLARQSPMPAQSQEEERPL